MRFQNKEDKLEIVKDSGAKKKKKKLQRMTIRIPQEPGNNETVSSNSKL